MRSFLILVLALAININVMAQDTAAPVPSAVEGSPAAANAADKALVDQNHKSESGSLDQQANKKKFKKNKKKHSSKKNHGAGKKHRKNKKSHT